MKIFNFYFLSEFHGFSFENQNRVRNISDITIRSHLKIAWSKFANDPSLKSWRFELLFLHKSKIFSLFFNQMEKVSFSNPRFKPTFNFVLPSSASFSALYLSLIDFVFNFHLVAIVAMTQTSTYRKQVCTLYS